MGSGSSETGTDSEGEKPGRTRVVLSVDPARFSEIVRTAVEAGLVVEEEMRTSGVVSGHVDTERIPALADLEGVESLERERTFQLPPPDSPVQ